MCDALSWNPFNMQSEETFEAVKTAEEKGLAKLF